MFHVFFTVDENNNRETKKKKKKIIKEFKIKLLRQETSEINNVI